MLKYPMKLVCELRNVDTRTITSTVRTMNVSRTLATLLGPGFVSTGSLTRPRVVSVCLGIPSLWLTHGETGMALGEWSMRFDDDDSEFKGLIYSRITRSGYGGRSRAEVSINADGVLRVTQSEGPDMTRSMTANELSLVAVVCSSLPVFALPETVDLPRRRSGSTTTMFWFLGQTVSVNDLRSGIENVPPALEILNDLFDNLMNWS